jgi:ribose-phosphate pyrophosphokinase
MNLRIVSGTAGRHLAEGVATALSIEPSPCEVERFPDGELRPAVSDVRGADVYVLQPTGPPVSDNLVELLLLLDACRRAGATRISAVVPYFGYARQDRRSRPGEAVGARVAAEAMASAGAARLVVVDPHTPTLEAMVEIPVEMVTAVPSIAKAAAPVLEPDSVIVAPDLGAVKLAERYATQMGCPVAIVRKSRVTGTTVRAEEIVGDVQGCHLMVVDDMISTGGTIEAAVRLLTDRGARPGALVAATHGLFVGGAVERLTALQLRRVITTDSTASTANGLPVTVCSLGPLLADTIRRLHHNQQLDDLLIPT